MKNLDDICIIEFVVDVCICTEPVNSALNNIPIILYDFESKLKHRTLYYQILKLILLALFKAVPYYRNIYLNTIIFFHPFFLL